MENPVINSTSATIGKVLELSGIEGPTSSLVYSLARWFHVLPVLEILPSTPSYDATVSIGNSLRRTNCSVR